jgi:gas vesicle protein
MKMNYEDRGTENNSESFVGSFGTTLFIGLTIGLVAVLLLAPKAGKESRGMVKAQFSSVRDKVMRRGSTNGGESQEESLESAVRADYLH